MRRRLSELYRWVLVDELHDVNPVQARIVEAIAGEGGNLVAVADPDQAIYSWRGADPGVVERFAAVPGTRVFPLQTNYRSTPEVVALAQATLPAGNPFEKRLRAQRPASGERPVVAHLASVQDEARFVVQRIADLITAGPRARARSPSSTGPTTTRSTSSSPWPRPASSSSSSPGARFVESAHVKDVLAFCRLRHNPRDELAWHRALRLFDRVGEAVAPRVWAEIGAAPGPPRGRRGARARRARAARGLARFAGGGPRPSPAMTRPEEIVLRVARSDWYRDHLQRDVPQLARPRGRPGAAGRARRPRREPRPLPRRPPARRAGGGRRGRVRPGPPGGPLERSTRRRASSGRWCSCSRSRPGSFPSGWAVSEGNLDEEERLFYVAVTRAADELYLCRPDRRPAALGHGRRRGRHQLGPGVPRPRPGRPGRGVVGALSGRVPSP